MTHHPSHEANVLAEARTVVAAADAHENAILAASRSFLRSETVLFRELLSLLDAAIRLNLPVGDSQEQAAAILASEHILEDLLRHGWNGILLGHYAGAGQCLRLIHECCDYIAAVPSSAEVARKFLNEEKLERSEVIKAIEQDLGTRDPQAFNQWNTKRLEVWQNLQATAHLSWFALELGAHTRHGRTFFGHDLNKRTALYLAVCYLDAALYGTLCLGQALQEPPA